MIEIGTVVYWGTIFLAGLGLGWVTDLVRGKIR
jgi:hypothetical protein